MERSLAIFISLTFLGVGLLGVAFIFFFQLTPEHRRSERFKWMLSWFIKGFIIPLTLWGLMNIGLSWAIQPYMPRIQKAQMTGGPWIFEYLRAASQGLFVISSYWTALTICWLLVQAGKVLDGEAWSDFKALCWTCVAGMSLPAIGIVYLGGWTVAGLAAAAIVIPIAGYMPAILGKKPVPPMYAKAIAKMKFGKYSEAEWDIIKELEKQEDDFQGWMMLAELYAMQFKDLGEAEQTILEICDQPRTSPSQISVALHKLAEWQVNMAGDPDAARRALQMISDRLPMTHLDHMAQLRINQLPKTAEDLHEQKTITSIPMPALGDQLDDPLPPEPTMDRQAAAALANEYVGKLKRDPNNIGAREKLARVFTEQLQKPELGIEQLGLLLELPDQNQSKKAEWLCLTAAWHLRYRQDPDTAKEVLEQVISQYPDSAQAFSAKRRIRLIETEAIKASARQRAAT